MTMPEKKLDITAIEVQAHLDAYFDFIKLFRSSALALQKKEEEKIDFDPVKESLINIINLIKKNDRPLLGIANSPYSWAQRKAGINAKEASIFIYGLNVAIYAVNLSVGLAASDEHLLYIGMASICNHLGLLNSIEFNPLETGEVAREESVEYMRKMRLSNFDLESLLLIHGLVSNKKNVLIKTSVQESMYQYAVIVNLSSTFEKLTHSSHQGNILAAYDAMKLMRTEMDDYFSRDIIKIFFNEFSIYPIGTYVKLNTRETAKIVAINKNFVMRPVIIIVLDEEGREKIQPVKINLREKPNLHIKHGVVDPLLSEKYITLF
jgi:hypothetical protein